MPNIRFLGAVLLLISATACGGGGDTAGPDLGFLVQASVAPPTSAAAGSVLPIAVKVLHKESGGGTTPVAGKAVTLTVTAGGGTVNGAGSATVTSGADGSVSATWTLGPALGAQTLRGSVSSTEFLDFTLTATQPPPSQLALSTQPSAAAQSGAALAQQPTVQLKDAGGNNVPQAGVAVTAAIASGGGILGGTVTVNTNASGAAVFTDLVVSGVIGNRTLSFTATLNGSSATVSSGSIALAAGAAAQLTVTTQPSNSAVGGVALGQQPAVQLQDAAGNNVAQAGVVVTASVATGPGSVSGTATATTDAAGVATFAGLGVTGGAGQVTVTVGFAATLGGQPRSTASGNITVIPPPQLLIATAPSANPRSNIEFFQQPMIQLADGLGNEVHQAGVAVTVSLASGTGELAVGLFVAPTPAAPAAPGASLTMLTDANGRAQFHDLNILGTGNHTLRFAAPGYVPATSGTLTLTNLLVNTAPNGLGELGQFSGAAGSDAYIRFVVPAGTNDLSFDTYGGPGDVTLYVRQGGDFPTLADHANCPLNPSGPVQRCVFTGAAATPGVWYVVTHGVTAFSNVRMQGAAYGPACAQTPLFLGVTVGPRTFAPATDCNVPFGPLHRYRFTSASQQTISLTVASSDFVSLLIKDPESSSGRVDAGVPTGGTTPIFLMGAHPLDIVAFPISGAPTYSITVNPVASPNVTGCPFRGVLSGVNTTLTLASTDCPGISAGTLSNRFEVVIGGNQTLTVSATPAPGTFAPRIRIMDGLVPSGVPASVLVTADGTVTQGATLVFTNPGAINANYTIEVTSVLPGQTGSYVLKVDAAPNYFNLAPPAFLKVGSGAHAPL